jgi:AraC-like DNA-binding protein
MPGFSSVTCRRVVETLAFNNLDVAKLLAGANINPQVLAQRDGRLSNIKVNRLWQLAAEQSGNPAIGIAPRPMFRLSDFHVLGYAMISCANLLEALKRIVDYATISSKICTSEVIETQQGYKIVFLPGSMAASPPRSSVEYSLIMLVDFCRWVSDQALAPIHIELPFERPVDSAPYYDAFRCMPQFDSRFCALHFSREDMLAPLGTSNAELAVMHDRLARDYLSRLRMAPVTHQVNALIIKEIAKGEPRRDQAAVKLGMSERTLQRRLHEEGASFTSLVDEARCNMAERYLSDLQLPTIEIAYLLGFSDQRCFFRACSRWFKMSPNQYRAKAKIPSEIFKR